MSWGRSARGPSRPRRAGRRAGTGSRRRRGYSRGPDKTWACGGLRVADGQAVTLCAPSRNSEHYQRFLQQVEDANPRGQIIVITDNHSSHDSKSTRAWLEDHPRIRHAFIPKRACWLNLQEGWWRIFRKTALAGQTFAGEWKNGCLAKGDKVVAIGVPRTSCGSGTTVALTRKQSAAF